jgi:hypothetical protein
LILSKGSNDDEKILEAENLVGAVGEEIAKVEKKDNKGLFGLSVTNPQDWITVILSSIIVYETFDLVVFWFQKLTGLGIPTST